MAKQDSQSIVLTVGHSTRPLAGFIALLVAHWVTRLVDVRTVPRSRHNPQFNRDNCPAALETAGIHYAHAAGLGGFRRAGPESRIRVGVTLHFAATPTTYRPQNLRRTWRLL